MYVLFNITNIFILQLFLFPHKLTLHTLLPSFVCPGPEREGSLVLEVVTVLVDCVVSLCPGLVVCNVVVTVVRVSAFTKVVVVIGLFVAGNSVDIDTSVWDMKRLLGHFPLKQYRDATWSPTHTFLFIDL